MMQVLRKGTDLIRKQNVQVFNNSKLGIKVRTIKNEDGSISINAEDTAIGFGWSEVKHNKVYPRWRTINTFIKETGISQEVAKDDYIPESLFYLLGMKANNDIARKFQTWLATDVIPQIRKTGSYQSEQPKSSLDLLELQVKALKEVKGEVQEVRNELEEFKEDLPLIGSEPEELQAVVRSVGTRALGGYDSPAYKDKSLSGKVYKSVWKYVKDQFNVKKYKSIKRKHLEKAKELAKSYEAPFYLQEEIDMLNNQETLEV